MTRTVTVAATQMGCSWDRQANLAQAEKLVREAAAQGAQVILIQELFETPYFCQKPNPDYLQLATRVEDNPAIKHFQALAKELAVVLPISFFELAGRARFNSVARKLLLWLLSMRLKVNPKKSQMQGDSVFRPADKPGLRPESHRTLPPVPTA